LAKKTKKSNFFEWIEAFVIALVFVLVFRTFLFDMFVVPTNSMEGTIKAGDFIVVNKMNYGARLPITPLSLPFFHQKIKFLNDNNSYLKYIQLPYFRFFGFGSIKRNDVVVFNYPLESYHPIDQRTYYVKRIIGMPGDKLKIERKNVFINDSLIDNLATYHFNYHIKTSVNDFHPQFFANSDISEYRNTSNQGDWQITTHEISAKKISSAQEIKSIARLSDKKNKFDDFIFPYSKNYKWNKDHFGPITIPQANDTIFLTLNNIVLYQQIIEKYEENLLEIDDTLLFINNIQANYYVPKMNYYFVMGDNRDNSTDSRYWGFVPENHLLGKTSFVLFSVDKNSTSFFNRMRWKRMFKRIY
jgi:signal peptidase I